MLPLPPLPLPPLPLPCACACADRTNLSFAALQLNRDLALSCRTYGLGASLFFISYAAFQM